MIYINNVNIYDEDTARDFLRNLGMDGLDIEEMRRLLCEEETEKVRHEMDILEEDRDCYEATCDHYHSLMNEVVNILDEMLAMQRIAKPRFWSSVNLTGNKTAAFPPTRCWSFGAVSI